MKQTKKFAEAEEEENHKNKKKLESHGENEK